MNSIFNWGSVAVIVGGYVLGFYFQNRRIDDLRDTLNHRVSDLNETMNRRFSDLNEAMNHRFSDLKDFIKSEVSRLEERIERLEHPVAKP